MLKQLSNLAPKQNKKIPAESCCSCFLLRSRNPPSAGFKAHRSLIAGLCVDGKPLNGIRKAIDRVFKPAKDVAVDHIVTFTVKNSSELFPPVIAGDTAIVSGS